MMEGPRGVRPKAIIYFLQVHNRIAFRSPAIAPAPAIASARQLSNGMDALVPPLLSHLPVLPGLAVPLTL